jgi:predicted SnoaL-like aldol condensation-catalyzing enzyme
MVDYSTEVEQIYATLSGQPPHTEEQIAIIKTTIELYQATFKYYDYTRTRELVDKSYKQHSQLVGGSGPDSIIQASKTLKSTAEKNWVGPGQPYVKLIFKRILVDGDYVMVQIFSEGWPSDTGAHVFDLFRLENGKFVEHWDAIQEIKPETIKRGYSVF